MSVTAWSAIRRSGRQFLRAAPACLGATQALDFDALLAAARRRADDARRSPRRSRADFDGARPPPPPGKRRHACEMKVAEKCRLRPMPLPSPPRVRARRRRRRLPPPIAADDQRLGKYSHADLMGRGLFPRMITTDGADGGLPASRDKMGMLVATRRSTWAFKTDALLEIVI